MRSIFTLAMEELAPGLCWTGTIKTKQDFETQCYRIVDSKLSESPSDFGCTWEELETKMASLQAERDAQEYARNRAEEYPDWGAQLNKIYDDGIDKWKSEMVDPVKAKWPKDNSGPK